MTRFRDRLSDLGLDLERGLRVGDCVWFILLLRDERYVMLEPINLVIMK